MHQVIGLCSIIVILLKTLLIMTLEAHSWKNIDEPIYHHSVKPISSDSDLSIDPVFILSFALPLVLFFFQLFEKPIYRAFLKRRSPLIFSNSYTYSKNLIVLHN